MRSNNQRGRLAALESTGSAATTISAWDDETTAEAVERRGLTDFRGTIYVVRFPGIGPRPPAECEA